MFKSFYVICLLVVIGIDFAFTHDKHKHDEHEHKHEYDEYQNSTKGTTKAPPTRSESLLIFTFVFLIYYNKKSAFTFFVKVMATAL